MACIALASPKAFPVRRNGRCLLERLACGRIEVRLLRSWVLSTTEASVVIPNLGGLGYAHYCRWKQRVQYKIAVP